MSVSVEPTRSAHIWRFMAAYFRRYLRGHMNAVRLSRAGPSPSDGFSGPLVVYCNHPSWWDPAVLIVLSERLFPGREAFAPFDAAMLARYRIFGRIGAFPVDLTSRRGAAQFLAASRAILARPNRILWVTAQGRFADVRLRPLGLRPGVAHLAEIAPAATFLPLALEYAFWDERGPEAFCAFGVPLSASELLALPRSERLARLESALTGILDTLSADVIQRDPARFVSLLDGRRGIGGVYDLWRRLQAWKKGDVFDPAHRPEQGCERASS